MKLYTKNGSYPSELPFRIRLSNGMSRTDPSTFTDEEISAAGYILAPDQPTSLSTQVVEWVGTEWIVRDKTIAELQSESNIRRNLINAERDRRIQSGFVFNEIKYDSRPEDQKRISAAAQLAFMAMLNGAQPNDYMWASTQPFGWIAQDNSVVFMDAQTVIDFAKTAAEWERVHIFAARTLKDMETIPEDFNDDKWW